MIVLTVLDFVVFAIFAVNVLYLLLFAALSLIKVPAPRATSKPSRRIAVLIPAYKEDSVIEECAKSALAQRYPRRLFDVVVVSDSMSEATNNRLARLSKLRLVVVNFERSTKVKALNAAMAEIGDKYDIAVILDADNVVSPTFLDEINAAFDAGYHAVQAHRTAKNMNTDVATLDALSEEINNSLLRKGHAAAGLSAALIGSGMAFSYKLLRDLLGDTNAVGGFDKALDLTLTYHRIKVAYLQDTLVLDEKVQSSATFSSQRRRWLSAQCHYFAVFARDFFPQLFKGNIDFCDKVFQNVMIPRLILIGANFIIAVAVSLANLSAAVKWWALLVAVLLAMMLATPRKLYTARLAKSLIKLPHLFLLFAGNIFKLRNANRTFIHTPHGIK